MPPAIGKHRDMDKYITGVFIPAMRKTFADANYEYVKPESSIENDNIWLIVVSRKIYRINEDYSWERSEGSLYAAGSGEKIAIGAVEGMTDGKPIKTIADGNPDYYWIWSADNEKLPYLVRDGAYKNVNVIEFDILQRDVDMLTERVLECGKHLQI